MSAEGFIGEWPVWQVMLAEIVVGMHDGRIATGRNPSRNVALTMAALPQGLVEVAREQNVTRAARRERPATGPRMVGSVPEIETRPAAYSGLPQRKQQAIGDHARHIAGGSR